MIGLDDVVVVETKDAIMVANKNKVQDIKKVVNRLKEEKRPEFEFLAPLFPLFQKMASIPLIQESIKVLQETTNEYHLQLLNNSAEIQAVKEHLADEAQWLRRPSLVFHGLPNVPTKKKGTAFSKYVANQVNRLLPNLPDKVTYKDIHASHPLGKAVLARFQRRDLKNEIYRRRFHLTDRRASVTEHLTKGNLDLAKECRKAAQPKGDVWSEEGKIYAKVRGKKRLIKNTEDPFYYSVQ